MKNIIPFHEPIKLDSESVATELMVEIEKCAKRYKLHPHDFSATYELLPDPRGKKFGHFLNCEVYTYKKLKDK